MGKAKQSNRRKRPPFASRPTISPLDDKQIERVAGIPDEVQIDEAARCLGAADQKVFQRVRRLLAEHLGSHAAARLWLVSPMAGFETTPLDAVRTGQAKLVLATLESQWGPSPTYA